MKLRIGTRLLVLAFAAAGTLLAAAASSCPAPASPGSAAVTGLGGEGWNVTAVKLRGRNGDWFHVLCPAGGKPGPVWGTDVYSDDSSICGAGVHAGRASLESGTMVTVEIRPGQATYTGSVRNGVTSGSRGASPGSFAVVGAFASAAQPALGGTWKATAKRLRGKVGRTFWFACPAPGTLGARVWGTGVYADESSVCAAAVHAGRISPAWGAYVQIEIAAGRSNYAGSTRHRVASRARGSCGGSFRFVD